MPRQGLLFELLKKYISAVCLENFGDFIDFVPELYDVLSFFSCCPGRRWQARPSTTADRISTRYNLYCLTQDTKLDPL
jgi:hypothetical protein